MAVAPEGVIINVDLAPVVDWFSRRVLSRRVSITREAAFRADVLQEAGSDFDAALETLKMAA